MSCLFTQERPGLVVLTIELEGALTQMPGSLAPSKLWSPYREPLAKFLNKYSQDVSPCALSFSPLQGAARLCLPYICTFTTCTQSLLLPQHSHTLICMSLGVISCRPSTTFWSQPDCRTPATSGAFWTSSSPAPVAPSWNTSHASQTSW